MCPIVWRLTRTDQVSEELDPQEVTFLETGSVKDRKLLETAVVIIYNVSRYWIDMNNYGFIRPVSVGMDHRSIYAVKDGVRNLTSALQREYMLLRAHQESAVQLWIKRHAEMGQFLDVKIMGHLEVHLGLEIQFSSTYGEHQSMFGYSISETQIDSCKSCDTLIQMILQEVLKKLKVEAYRKLIRSSRQFTRDLSLVHPMTIFHSWKVMRRHHSQWNQFQICFGMSHHNKM